MLQAACRADQELRMVEGMVDCAYAVGRALHEAQAAEADWSRRLELIDAFHRSGQAVRLGIRLSMTLRAPPKPVRAEREAPERLEPEGLDFERPERPDWERPETERDRDYEPVSLPKFLATLGVVAATADRLGDRLPGEVRDGALPALHDLLAQAKDVPAAPKSASLAVGVTVSTRPPPAASRAALLGSASPGLSSLLRFRGPGRPRPPPD